MILSAVLNFEAPLFVNTFLIIKLERNVIIDMLNIICNRLTIKAMKNDIPDRISPPTNSNGRSLRTISQCNIITGIANTPVSLASVASAPAIPESSYLPLKYNQKQSSMNVTQKTSSMAILA